MTQRLRTDGRGISTFQWLGIAATVLVLLSLIPQFRALLDVAYEHLVGKNNLGPDGQPAPGVLVRGIIVGVTSLVVFVGSIFFINFTNLGKRLAFLVTGAAFFGFMAMVGLFYSLYAPRGLRPASIEGLNAFQLRILPGALMLGSLILFAMFVTALSRYDQEQTDSAG
ncbi:MAG: hypothetical protein ABIJ75_02665 [Actinomycetota bacterium]